MSSRALRKAQREREEQDKLMQLEQSEDAESDNEAPAPSKKSAFAMLETEEAEDDVEDEGDEEESGGIQVESEQTSAPIPKTSGKKKKKKRKKAKADQDQTETENEVQLDEIDQALKQLSTNGHASTTGTTAAGISASTEETSKLLSIDTNHLHAHNEMRRLFGRAALEQQDEDEGGQNDNVGGNRRQQRRVNQVGLAQALRRQGGANGRAGGLASIALRRNIFIQGKEEWPVATGGGLGMEIEEKRADGTVLYRFVHNRIYQDVQAQFNIAVESMDPNRLVVLLQHNPYHISTLLQVSEIAKQDRDHSTSGDLLERALFSFGRAVHSTFAKNLAEGKARLDFARPENREFWLASWRYMQNLSMRATWRTVYEWAKLLISLSPEDDPYAMWLAIDQYALRSRQDFDFLNMSRNPTFKHVHGNMPNVQLSQGLAEWRAGNKNKGQQALFTAIGRFPWVVARLMQELALDPPPAIWGKEARTEKEKLHSELYATRAKDLWNTPETSALLVEVASAVPSETPSAEVDDSDIATNEARHVLLSDTPSLIALIPRKFTAQILSSSDPLPPVDNNPSYTLTYSPSRPTNTGAPSSRGETLRELHGLYDFFTNLFPWYRREGDADEPPEHPDEEAVQARIRESGVDEQLIVQRTQRLMELQAHLGRQPVQEEGGAWDGLLEEIGEDGVEVRNRTAASVARDELVVAADDEGGQRARVEDAEDAGD